MATCADVYDVDGHGADAPCGAFDWLCTRYDYDRWYTVSEQFAAELQRIDEYIKADNALASDDEIIPLLSKMFLWRKDWLAQFPVRGTAKYEEEWDLVNPSALIKALAGHCSVASCLIADLNAHLESLGQDKRFGPEAQVVNAERSDEPPSEAQELTWKQVTLIGLGLMSATGIVMGIAWAIAKRGK